MKLPNIAKNTSYFTLALILQKVISFSYFIIIARSIGPENLGKYYFAISFTTIFAIFIDIGMVHVLIRETAKERDNAEKFFRNIFGIKVVLAVFSLLTVYALINLMGYPKITRDLVYLSSIAMILDSFALTFFGLSRGFHNLKFESVGVVAYQAIILLLGTLFLQLNFSLRWLMSALVVASVINFLYAASLIVFKWKISLWPRWEFEFIKKIIIMAAPFAIYGIFQRFYTYFDSILLSLLAGDTYVGLYSVAFKIIFALQFLPLAFVASLYPAMSAYYVKNTDQLAKSFERAMNYLTIISLPISFGIIVLADQIILIFNQGYSGSILPLQIIMGSLFFIFASYPVGSLLNACDRQKINTINMGIVLTLSLILNLLFIPRWQAVGASITVVITNALLLILGFAWVPRITKINYLKILKVLGQSLLAVFLMAFILFNIREFLNVFILIPAGAFIYFAFLYLFGGFSNKDVREILVSFKLK